MNSSPAVPTCAQRFAWVADDFSRVVGSGILAAGDEGLAVVVMGYVPWDLLQTFVAE